MAHNIKQLILFSFFSVATLFFSKISLADHGDMFPECPDVEVLGEVTSEFTNVARYQYVEREPGQATFNVTAEATVSGYCEIWGPRSVTDPECIMISSSYADINVFSIWSTRIYEDKSYLKKIDNQTHGQYLTLTHGLGAGVHQLRASNLARDTLCNTVDPNTASDSTTVYVDTHPPKEELGCSGIPEQHPGNPCNIANGNKYQQEHDFDSPLQGLSIERHYNSRNSDDLGLGVGWTTSFLKRLIIGVNVIHSRRTNGSRESFVFTNNTWQAGSDGTLSIVADAAGYILTRPDGGTEYYDLQGFIQSEEFKGYSLYYAYDISNQLQSVTSSYGHSMTFAYNSDGHIETITTAQADTFQYSYDSNNNLISVTYPGGYSRIYHFEDPGLKNALTGITDENNSRYSTYAYIDKGWANLTQHAVTDNGVGQEQYRISYRWLDGREVTITDPLGNQKTAYLTKMLGTKKVSRLVNLADNKSLVLTYDSRGNVASRTDEEGNRTNYGYNSGNQRQSMIDAVGTPQERQTLYGYYSPDIDLLSTVTRPSVFASSVQVTALTYDDNLNIDTITENGFQPDGTAITRSVDLDFNVLGKLVKVDGPRTDVSDITLYTYYNCNTGNECGQLQSTTNGLGHITTYDLYDANGRMLQMTEPSGLVTQYTYNAKGHIKSVTQIPALGSSRITTYTYHPTGLLHTVSTPTGLLLTYEYDAAWYLRRIIDSLGNKIEYNYDLYGNRTNESIFDPQGVLTHAFDMSYDVRNRLNMITQLGNVTQYVNDAVGNTTQLTDANNGVTASVFDALNRLIQSTDPLTQSTAYLYDVGDRITQVTAPNGAVTQYNYDDFGRLLQEISPDRGTLQYAYDSGGNRISKLDASGVITQYSYDALNRVKTVTYPSDTSENITYEYDSTVTNPHGVGRLTALLKANGHISYIYDAWGNIISESQTIDSTTYTTDFTYDGDNRLIERIYPSGRIVTYLRNNVGQVEYVATQADAGSSSTGLASAISYKPFGPVISLTLGNDYQLNFGYDNSYRVTNINSVLNSTLLHEWQYSYDPVGNILTLNNSQASLENQLFTYDPINRLESANGNYPIQEYLYDANGNRFQLTEDGAATDYSYQSGSNQLLSEVNTSSTWNYSHNANGQIITLQQSNGAGFSYDYSSANRLAEVWEHAYIPPKGNSQKKPGTVEDNLLYSQSYNALGQRNIKTNAVVSIHFIYDHRGELIAEFDITNSQSTEYIYLNKRPLAISVSSTGSTDIYYIHADHQGTPHYLTNNSGQTVWQARYEPFGVATVDEDVDGDGYTVTLNLRFPGQYYEQESGLHYNYYRDYDPRTGRYIQSDPIGLQGGLNTYAYVGGNPIRFVDPLGLVWETTDVDYHGAKNWFIGILDRLSSLDEGTVMNAYNFEHSTRDVTQTWFNHPDDPQNQRNYCIQEDPVEGDTRTIRQTFGNHPDPWAEKGKSWHWSPPVPSPTWD